MSIIMRARASTPAASGRPQLAADVALRNLLDHIAAELAEEYVRLMEAAADHERKQVGSHHTGMADEGCG